MTTNPTNDEASASERAFLGLLDRLRDAAAVITGPKGARDERERTEGFRYLTRVLGASLEMHLENADPQRPTLTRMLSPIRKFLGDNPDTDYDYVPLDPASTYLIRGRRTDITYLGFCVYARREEGGIEVASNVSDADLVFEPDGSFSLVLSASRPDGAANWLELPERTYAMLVRQYYFDRSRETRTPYTIERSPGAGDPAPMSAEEFATKLDEAGRYVADTADLSASLSVYALMNPVTDARVRKGGEVVDGEVDEERLAKTQSLIESIDPSIILGHMPTPDIAYTGASFELEDDEAVILEGRAPKARYWSAQIFNRWLESPDYRFHRVALNSKDVVVAEDGTFRIVLAARDPGVPNWLQTAGMRSGQIALRALISEDELEVEFRRVKLVDVPRGEGGAA